MSAATWALLIPAACLVCLYLGFRGVAWLFAELSGWHRLESQFGCKVALPAWTHSGQTVRVNSIRFRSCAKAAVQPDALYLRVSAIFPFPAIRVPWDQVSGIQPDQLYRRQAMRILVRDTSIAVDLPLYAAMYPHLCNAQAKRPAGVMFPGSAS